MARPTRQRVLHAAVVSAGLAPLGALVYAALTQALGANPVEEITHETGDWGLRFLVACLAVTPARWALGRAGWAKQLRAGLAPYRRSLGLLCFLYASLHVATWLVLEIELDVGLAVEDVLERPYITVGAATFLLLVPLAATSTRAAMRRLGRRWVELHRIVYIAAVGAVVHFLWLVKADTREPLVYAGIVAVLFAARLTQRRLRSDRASA